MNKKELDLLGAEIQLLFVHMLLLFDAKFSSGLDILTLTLDIAICYSLVVKGFLVQLMNN